MFERDEDAFQLRQLKVRANSRYKDSRCHAIDLFYIVYAGYIRAHFDDVSKEDIEKLYPIEFKYPTSIPSPLDVVKELVQMKDMDSLLSDIKTFDIAEHDDIFLSSKHSKDCVLPRAYWRALKRMIDTKKESLQQEEASSKKKTVSPDELVKEEIDGILNGKSFQELNELEEGIKMTLENESGIDEDYWRSLLQKLVIYKAQSQVIAVFDAVTKHADKLSQENVSGRDNNTNVSNNDTQRGDSVMSLFDQFVKSVKPVDIIDDEPTITEEMFLLREEENGFAENEEAFNDCVTLNDQSEAIQQALQKWDPEDKFRPRKPKYFNRVKTGYEWNKYNQTHYDVDNPPPKIVQGYKFNIFYPDLIDKSVAPKYSIEKTDSPDFVIIRFHAGPPYLDIAFKIVNKEWEAGHKKGFKSMFSNGVLYLWFNFKRLKYRR